MDEPFEEGDGHGCCSTAYLPAGWTWEGDWYGGDLSDGHGGIARRWATSSDGWLISSEFSLEAGVVYEISYSYRTRFGSGTEDFSIHIGTEQNSTNMLLSSPVSTASSSSTSYATQNGSFTVSTAGTYYLGIRAQQTGGDSAIIDDILLTGTPFQELNFYNLQVNSTGGASFSANAKVNNDLAVKPGAELDLGSYALSVEGALTNDGSLQQTMDVPNGSTTHFLNIQNAAGDTDKYYGVDITPEGADMGATTVVIEGNQAQCSYTNAGETIMRCFDISNASGNPATIRLYYLDSEKGTQNPDQMKIYHWDGSLWEALSMATTPVGTLGSDYHWVEAVSVSDFSPFAAADDAPSGPTAVTLVGFRADPAIGGVRLAWETALELDTLGFNLYRSATPDGERQQLNVEMIPAKAYGGLFGATYAYFDADVGAGRMVYYWLEAIYLDGRETFGPQAGIELFGIYLPIVRR